MISKKVMQRILSMEHLDKFGQLTDVPTENLGLGYLYYTLGRIYQPQTGIVIGSHRGFSVVCLAKALQDNRNGGIVRFIDPSLADDFWKTQNVPDYFNKFGLTNVKYYFQRSEDIFTEYVLGYWGAIGVAIIDGYHTYEQVKLEHTALLPYLRGPALFHDSKATNVSDMYDKPYTKSVGQYIDEMRKNPDFDVWEIPFAPGLAIVQRR